MTLRERMRRRGWVYHPWCDWYEKSIDGVTMQLWPRQDRVSEPASIIYNACLDTECVIKCGTEGIPSLAQRARALVRGRR